MNKNKLRTLALPLTLLAVALSISAFSQTTTAPSPDPKSIPVVDGAIGPCSADFTVTDAAGAPVYRRPNQGPHRLRIHERPQARPRSRHQLRRQSPLHRPPDRLKRGLYFEASEGDRTAEAFDDPAITCKAQFTVALRKKP